MKLFIDEDEFYPFYFLSVKPGYRNEAVEIPDEIATRYMAAVEEFSKAYDNLRDWMFHHAP